MDLYQTLKPIIERLDDVSESKKINAIRNELASIDEENRNRVEQALLVYLNQGVSATNRPKTVVILVHGIRDYALWQDIVGEILEEKIPDVAIAKIKYGYRGVLGFLIPSLLRKKDLHEVRGQLESIFKNYPAYKKVLVAHSFGTFLTSRVLNDCSHIRFDRILYCGSIVNESFKWHEVDGVPKNCLVNDCGTRDIWPMMAKSFTVGYGDSGVVGFHSYLVKDRYHDIRHGEFFSDKFVDRFWVPFISDGRYIKSSWTKCRPEKKWYWRMITVFPGVGVSFLGLVLVFLVVYLVY